MAIGTAVADIRSIGGESWQQWTERSPSRAKRTCKGDDDERKQDRDLGTVHERYPQKMLESQ